MENTYGQRFKIFKNLNLGEVRTTKKEGDPHMWFFMKDICDILGIQNSREVTIRLKDMGLEAALDTIEGYRNHANQYGAKYPVLRKETIVSELAITPIIATSRKSQAKEFMKWISTEVIPSLAKHGGYIMEEDRIEYYTKPETIKDLINNINYQKEMKELFFNKYQKLYNTALDLEKENHKLKRDAQVTGYNVGNFVIPLKMAFDLREWAIYNPLDRLHILTSLDEIITAIDNAFKSLSGDPEKIKEADEKAGAKEKDDKNKDKG